ncbi:23S rRNA m(6)A-1618 methyltransferase [Algoriphagus alkaliphilus]|uniref:Ribosomal RNA large subunit methyltransferase F n=1 Tax=Algoriphagus alkaliphilus TaxID=279824 RepID=A0A1G5UXR2_9BACT|nr:23S rRNA (adenine(1618)-N(6))-methyltransferase RlmF [Algoriphagus alkaliphilus]MBA4300741.1 23S rRNA (adenine(1618)-N(6))-methyltransferase RlmF [Cyclobacterium sp.]SDA38431.1 23S rRNA m(6)A-1618 methyltransferase [Algoriphagus alkaliphilus]
MKKQTPQPSLHPRNLHQGRYDLELLSDSLPELKAHIFKNEHGNLTLDFANPKAVKSLNQALLKCFYQIEFWDIPDGFLCPPIPGRADYIHYLADVLGESKDGKIPKGSKIKVLDIGTGANLIYPILGNSIYDWSFVGSELNPVAIDSAQKILAHNQKLHEKIELRFQPDSSKIFSNIILVEDFFDLTVCNPPFHESAQAAQEVSRRKVQNLTGKLTSKPVLNFGGQANELWTDGGELEFIRKMIEESLKFKNQVCWFTTLVSKSENLKSIHYQLEKASVFSQKTIQMAQGNKESRFVAWTFLTEKQRENRSEGHRVG